MAKFITGNALNLALENLFLDADKQLVLISPFIKMHQCYIDALKGRLEDHKLEIIIVFGKNEGDLSKSLPDSDFYFFKKFPNIEIRYEKRLHAKFYLNDDTAIISSMNLHSYSQENNIEAGILTKASLLRGITDTILSQFKNDPFDYEAFDYFSDVIDNAELLYKKAPQYEKKIFGLQKVYKGSIVEKDELSRFYNLNIPVKADYASKTGYCIRCNVKIPFNIKEPMCMKCFEKWKKYGNKDYSEDYCHFSGEESFEETSMARPVMWKNWNEAQFVHNI
ncbi:MAG: phospholipase D family protein [Ferruginibacter sp.]